MKALFSICVLLVIFCCVAEAGEPPLQREGINVQFSQTPLTSVIQRLAAISNISIAIDGRHSNPPITATLDDKSLDDALSTVLRSVSHMIIRQSDGAYSVLILEGDDADTEGEPAPQQTARAASAPLPLGLGLGEPELFPGQNGSPGLTQQDLDYYEGAVVPQDASKLEVIPPVDGFSAAITLEELREYGGSAGPDAAAVVADIDTIPGGFN